jgi:hypothetical protein
LIVRQRNTQGYLGQSVANARKAEQHDEKGEKFAFHFFFQNAFISIAI